MGPELRRRLLHYDLCHLLAVWCHDANYFISPCLYFLFSKMLTAGLLRWLSGKGSCHQTWQYEFNPQALHW